MADILPPSTGMTSSSSSVFNLQGDKRKKTSAKKQALIENLASTSEEVAASVEEIAAAVEQSSKSSQSIATAAEEASRNAEANREAVTNLKLTIKYNFDQAKLVKDHANDIQTKLDLISKDITILNKSIDESTIGIETSLNVVEVIENVAKDVEDAVSAIMKIADRTNLLALNAAIEAAKAEEHGKGLSVVAEEVRILTEMSEENANTIQKVLKELLGQVNVIVDQAKTSVDDGKKQIRQGEEATKFLQDAIVLAKSLGNTASKFISLYEAGLVITDDLSKTSEQIAVAAEEQSSAAEQINRSAGELNTAVSQIGTAAEELRAMSQELRDSVNIDSKASDQVAVAAEELSSSIEESIRMQSQIRQAIEQLASTAEEQARASESMKTLSIELLNSSEEIVSGSKKAVTASDDVSIKNNDSKSLLTDIAVGIDNSVTNLRDSTEKLSELKKNVDFIGIAVSKLDLVMVQTNMLSVNGFIEAARSGEFGKGFEVVSGDIKNLSQNGFESIETLKRKLRDIVEQMDRLSNQLAISSTRASGEAQRSNDLSEQIDIVILTTISIKDANLKANEDALGMTKDIQAISKASEQIAAAAEETSRTTDELSKASEQIVQASSQLSIAVNNLAAIADELQNI